MPPTDSLYLWPTEPDEGNAGLQPNGVWAMRTIGPTVQSSAETIAEGTGEAGFPLNFPGRLSIVSAFAPE